MQAHAILYARQTARANSFGPRKMTPVARFAASGPEMWHGAALQTNLSFARDKMALVASNQVTVTVRVQPNSRRNMIVGFKEGILHVKVAAPPVEGKANEALVRYLSDVLNVRKSDLTLIRGLTGRNKTITIAGIDQERLVAVIEHAARLRGF